MSPSPLPAGGCRATLHVDPSRSPALVGRPKALALAGVNDWQVPLGELPLLPSGLTNGEGRPWLAASFDVPRGAYNVEFALTDGGAAWDNNGRANYRVTIEGGPTREEYKAAVAAAAAAEASAKEVRARSRACERPSHLSLSLVPSLALRPLTLPSFLPFPGARRQRAAAAAMLDADERRRASDGLAAAARSAGDALALAAECLPGVWRTSPPSLASGEPAELVSCGKAAGLSGAPGLILHVRARGRRGE